MGTVLCGIAMYCSVESDLGVVASHQQGGWGAGVADNLYILFSLRFGMIWGGLALAAQTHMQADWTGLYNMRNTVFATAGKAREVNVF